MVERVYSSSDFVTDVGTCGPHLYNLLCYVLPPLLYRDEMIIMRKDIDLDQWVVVESNMKITRTTVSFDTKTLGRWVQPHLLTTTDDDAKKCLFIAIWEIVVEILTQNGNI